MDNSLLEEYDGIHKDVVMEQEVEINNSTPSIERTSSSPSSIIIARSSNIANSISSTNQSSASSISKLLSASRLSQTNSRGDDVKYSNSNGRNIAGQKGKRNRVNSSKNSKKNKRRYGRE